MTGIARTAVILAAGMGQRLGDLAGGRPKGLLRLGAQSLVEESIARLRAAGITRVVIGTGYGAQHYAPIAAGSHGLVEFQHNDRYAETGSMYTLARVAEHVDDDVLLLESDIVYESRALDALQCAGDGSTLLVSGFSAAGDEVFVEADAGGILVALSKDRALLGPRVIGEFVGIARISRETLRQMVASATQMFATSVQVDYETVLAAVSAVTPVRCLLIEDLVWTEIDDAAHLARAQTTVYPRIAPLHPPTD